MTKKIKAELEFEVPAVPNFIKTLKDGNSYSIPIHTLADDSIDIVIEAWGEKLKEHVKKQREGNK